MSFNYTPGVDTDLNYVRMLIRDTDPTAYAFEDEEIQLVIDRQTVPSPANRYYAAAEIMEFTLAEIAGSAGAGGVTSKAVSQLKITWGISSSSADALRDVICAWRRRGSWLSQDVPRSLKVYRAN